MKTAVYEDCGLGTRTSISYCALKLSGESGEVGEKIAKALYRRDPGAMEVLEETVEKELGDVLWYVSQLCNEFGLSLAEVAQKNLTELADRKARGVLQGSGDNR